MSWSEIDAGHSEISTERGSARSLVPIDERVVGYDAEGVSARLIDSAWVQVCAIESLERLSQRRIEKSLVAQTVKSAEPLDCRRMDVTKTSSLEKAVTLIWQVLRTRERIRP